MQIGGDRPSLTELGHRDHLARRRDILQRLEGVESITGALEAHWVDIAPAQESEAQSFRPLLASWRQLRGKRVLVIDDDASLVRILLRMLINLGVTADSAPDGEEGLALARATPYDIVVVDLNMPGMPGMLVVEALRRQSARPDVPVLICSGVASQDELDAVAKECGATAALAKAFSQEDFEAAVRRLLTPGAAGTTSINASDTSRGISCT